jgi:hypothetical protein
MSGTGESGLFGEFPGESSKNCRAADRAGSVALEELARNLFDAKYANGAPG